MNAELPPFKNGEHNSESASTPTRGLTLLTLTMHSPFLDLISTSGWFLLMSQIYRINLITSRPGLKAKAAQPGCYIPMGTDLI